jgi:hypothetical protein
MAQTITEADVDAVVALLPETSYLKRYVDYGKRSTDCHSAYHLLSGLSALAQTCPTDYCLNFGSPIYANLYSICVGPSTESRKSASISLTRSLLNEAIPGSVGEEPGSRENLIDSLQQNPRQVIVYSEFGAFLSQSEKGYLNPLRTTYTDAYDCNPLGRATVRKKQNNIQAVAQFPRLSILAGSTLEYLERHTEPVDWTGGFLARFLIMYAEKRERTNKVPPPKQSDRDTFVMWLKNLTSFCQFGIQRGKCLGLSPEAIQLWEVWYDTLRAPDAMEIKGAVARSYAQALKIALILAWDFGAGRGKDDFYIGVMELKAATAIVDLHVRSIIRIGEGLAPSQDMRNRKTVLECLRNGPAPLGDMIKASRLTRRRTQEMVETLLEEGTITVYQENGVAGQWYRNTTSEERYKRFHSDGGGASGGIFPTEPAVVYEQPANVISVQFGSPMSPSSTTGTNANSLASANSLGGGLYSSPADSGIIEGSSGGNGFGGSQF